MQVQWRKSDNRACWGKWWWWWVNHVYEAGREMKEWLKFRVKTAGARCVNVNPPHAATRDRLSEFLSVSWNIHLVFVYSQVKAGHGWHNRLLSSVSKRRCRATTATLRRHTDTEAHAPTITTYCLSVSLSFWSDLNILF